MVKWVKRDSQITWVGGLGLGFLVAASLSAGSVFMKNGYIVQGAISDRTAEQVVVEWPSGRVIIPRRFVENVVLEPQDEQRIQRKHDQKPAQAEAGEGVVERFELPADPQELLPTKKIADAGSGVLEIMSPSTLPTVELGERQVVAPGLIGSLPVGWKLKRDRDAWIAEGSSDEKGGSRARIAGTFFSDKLGRQAQIALAKEEVGSVVSKWQLLEEGQREVGFREGYEILGRGEHEGGGLWSRQILVWVDEGAWLLSCVWPSEGELARTVESCLQTFEFDKAEGLGVRLLK